MAMESRHVIPEICSVCDAPMVHYEGGKDEEHSGYWNHMVRFGCGSVLAIHGRKTHKVTADIPCPEAQRLAVKYREGWTVANDEIKELKAELANTQEACLRYQFKADELKKQPLNRTAKRARTLGHPMNHGQPWTKAERAKLRNEHKQGLTVQRMAGIHGRTNGAIHSALQRAGVNNPKWEKGTGPDANWGKR